MKEEIYTIPVNEAIEMDGECLFCTLNQKLERDILDYILGPSYMEEDVRGETDKIGFCKKHYSQMYGEQNRLGVALMVDTHLKRVREDLKNLLNDEMAQNNGKKKRFKKNTDKSEAELYLTNIENSCYACNRMEARMKSYVDTFFHLWKRDTEFRDKIKGTKGFCLEHFNMLLREAKRRMDAEKYSEFLNAVVPVQLKNLDVLQEDVDWFIQKFDYRFKDEPWKNSEDAIPRAILKLSGELVER